MKIKIFTTLLCLASFSIFADDIQPGQNTNQLIASKGQPYYQTEHYSHLQGEQVWLYTKKKQEKNVEEKNINDTQSQWPTLYRKTTTRTCDIGDFFVEISKGKVKNVIPANADMAYGPCVVEVLEEFIPIVDGQPSKKPSRQIENTHLEKSNTSKK